MWREIDDIEIRNSSIITGDLNISLLIIHWTPRQKVSKGIEDTMN